MALQRYEDSTCEVNKALRSKIEDDKLLTLTERQNREIQLVVITDPEESSKMKMSLGVPSSDYDRLITNLCRGYNITDEDKDDLLAAKEYESDRVKLTTIKGRFDSPETYTFGYFATRKRSDDNLHDVAYAVYKTKPKYYIKNGEEISAYLLQKYYNIRAIELFTGVRQ